MERQNIKEFLFVRGTVMNKKQITKKQHYVPRMILKRFSCSSSENNKKYFIYQYDKEKDIERRVDIMDVCHKNNLYEIKDEQGNVLEANLIENSFANLEEKWEQIIRKIEKHQNLKKEDKSMLGLLLVLQLMRTPEIMELTSNWLYATFEESDNPLTKNEADKYMKLATFVWGEIKPETNWMLFLMLRKTLEDKDIVIYYSDSKFILNGDSPVFCLNEMLLPKSISDIYWILPLTEHCCLSLRKEGSSFPLYQKIDSNMVNLFNEKAFLTNGRFVYSSFSIKQNNDFKNLIQFQKGKL